jgi:GGDEF domain-containing protein
MLSESLAELERTQACFGLLHIRVLGLKDLSVRYGTDSIAAFLRTSAQTIRHNLSAKDFFGRWAEDDFMAILHSSSPIKIAAMAELISQQISESEIAWWGDHFRVQAEIGYVVAGPGDTPESLLSRMKQMHAAEAAATAGGATGSALSRG